MSNLNSAQNARVAWLMIGGMAMIGFVDNFIGPMAEVIGLWQFQIRNFKFKGRLLRFPR